MTVENLASFFNTPSAFTGYALAATLNGLSKADLMTVLRFLKEASVRDQCFEQAQGFRNAERALARFGNSKPFALRDQDLHAGPMENQLDKIAAKQRQTTKRRKGAKPA